MKRKPLISIKMTGDQVEGLRDIYKWLHGTWNACNAHDLLLQGHIAEFRDRLEKLLDKDQLTYLIRFGSTELLAFVQVWEDEPIALDPYHNMIILNIFKKLHLTRKSPPKSITISKM